MNKSYSITSKFQVTIPKDIRQAIGLSANDRIEFEHKGKDVILKRRPSLAEVQKLAKRLASEGRFKPATDKEIENARYKFYARGGSW